MDQRSLEKNLKNIERELVNLQTAHEIGLGTVKYYNYNGETEAQMDEDYYYRAFVLIEVNAGERVNPFMEIFVNYGGDFSSVLKNTAGTRYVINSLDIFPYTIVWTLVTTSMITWHYSYDVDEARAWLNG